MDKFLGYPTADPHGAPIPNRNGEMIGKKRIHLVDLSLLSRGHPAGGNRNRVALQTFPRHGERHGAGTDMRFVAVVSAAFMIVSYAIISYCANSATLPQTTARVQLIAPPSRKASTAARFGSAI